MQENSTAEPDPRPEPDRRDGRAYVPSPDLELAVRVALSTGRPLLLRGDPGSGKSSFAAHVAHQRGWRYYEHVVTARTEAQDLLWTFDHVRRLADAQARALQEDHAYVEPGVLWWAFAPRSARDRGAPGPLHTAWAVEPYEEINRARAPGQAVVLIDEIDKADPDLPNGLLVPLGSQQFVVKETRRPVAPEHGSGHDPRSRQLIVVTTNEERELPQAFLRRCVVLPLRHPSEDQLVAIAHRHLEVYEGEIGRNDDERIRRLAEILVGLREKAVLQARRPPSTAEFLDALHACRRLGITVGDEHWERVQEITLIKPPLTG